MISLLATIRVMRIFNKKNVLNFFNFYLYEDIFYSCLACGAMCKSNVEREYLCRKTEIQKIEIKTFSSIGVGCYEVTFANGDTSIPQRRKKKTFAQGLDRFIA